MNKLFILAVCSSAISTFARPQSEIQRPQPLSYNLPNQHQQQQPFQYFQQNYQNNFGFSSPAAAEVEQAGRFFSTPSSVPTQVDPLPSPTPALSSHPAAPRPFAAAPAPVSVPFAAPRFAQFPFAAQGFPVSGAYNDANVPVPGAGPSLIPNSVPASNLYPAQNIPGLPVPNFHVPAAHNAAAASVPGPAVPAPTFYQSTNGPEVPTYNSVNVPAANNYNFGFPVVGSQNSFAGSFPVQNTYTSGSGNDPITGAYKGANTQEAFYSAGNNPLYQFGNSPVPAEIAYNTLSLPAAGVDQSSSAQTSNLNPTNIPASPAAAAGGTSSSPANTVNIPAPSGSEVPHIDPVSVPASPGPLASPFSQNAPAANTYTSSLVPASTTYSASPSVKVLESVQVPSADQSSSVDSTASFSSVPLPGAEVPAVQTPGPQSPIVQSLSLDSVRVAASPAPSAVHAYAPTPVQTPPAPSQPVLVPGGSSGPVNSAVASQRSGISEKDSHVVSEAREVHFDGNFNYGFESENGISVKSRGYIRPAASATDNPVQVIEGSYTYIDASGKPQSISYIADENGYRAFGDGIPVASVPQVPSQN